MKPCPTCGREVADHRRSYCSFDCRPKRPCRWCGRPSITPSLVRAGFCSEECDRYAHGKLLAISAAKARLREEGLYPIRKAVTNALKKGALVRQPCEACGALKAEGHHADYTKPLEITWLCRSHHRREHLRIQAAAGKPNRRVFAPQDLVLQ
jgi:hypothetical protein